jgi:hypothetical protein
MKKFTTIGLILASMAMGVFLACATASNKKVKRGSKYIKITISTETGQLVKVTNENDQQADQLTPAELQQIMQNQAPLQIGEIFYTHSSPGCVIIVMFGSPYLVCY